MRLQEIERLLEKFYTGESSLEEERTLKEYFSGNEVPPHLQAERAHFVYLSAERKKGIAEGNFDHQVIRNVVPKEGILARFLVRRQLVYASIGVAATILILLAVFVRFDPFPKKIQDTYSDPEVAYAEAKKILLFVSGKFNRGAEKLQPLTAYDNGMQELNAIGTLNEGINAIGKIKKYNKIEQMIQKSN